MGRSVPSQVGEGLLRKDDKAVLAAFAEVNVYAIFIGINVRDSEIKGFG